MKRVVAVIVWLLDLELPMQSMSFTTKVVSLNPIHERHCLNALLDLVYGVQRHFQQYFIYVVAASFIGGGKHRPTDKLEIILSIKCYIYCLREAEQKKMLFA
jgi:hypothetical protein